MRMPSRITLYIPLVLLVISGHVYAFDGGLFRTIPVDTPKQSILWVSNTSFYSTITDKG